MWNYTLVWEKAVVESGYFDRCPGAWVQSLRVNSDKVQNVGQGQNLDHLRTPLIWKRLLENLKKEFYTIILHYNLWCTHGVCNEISAWRWIWIPKQFHMLFFLPHHLPSSIHFSHGIIIRERGTLMCLWHAIYSTVWKRAINQPGKPCEFCELSASFLVKMSTSSPRLRECSLFTWGGAGKLELGRGKLHTPPPRGGGAGCGGPAVWGAKGSV